jgi:hypothetical protein
MDKADLEDLAQFTTCVELFAKKIIFGFWHLTISGANPPFFIRHPDNITFLPGRSLL